MAHGATQIEVSIAYIHGRIEAEIEGYARSLGISTVVLTERLVALLHPSGQRAANTVPSLRRKTSPPSPATRKVEVAVDTHGEATQSRPLGRPRKSTKYANAHKAYWASMTKAERAAEVKRRLAVRKANSQKVA